MGSGWFFLGAVFCFAMPSYEMSAECASARCMLTMDFSILGISPWYIGGAGFLSLTFSLFFTKIFGGGGFRILAISGFLIDGCLLAWMFFGLRAPCTLCLMGAGFLAPAILWLDRRGPMALPIVAWVFLFVLCLGMLGNSYGASRRTGMEIWFAPSCGACIEVIERLADRKDIVYHPVVRNPEDERLVVLMDQALQKGKTIREAMRTARETDEKAIPSLELSSKLRQNAAYVAQNGGTLPLIVSHGLYAMDMKLAKDVVSVIDGSCGQSPTCD